MTYVSLIQLLESRRSVRRYQAKVPDDGLIHRLLQAAVSAPSASNKQPWRFIVISNKDVIATMAAEVRAAVDSIAEHIPAESQHAFRTYGDYFTRFEDAPVVIAPIHRGHRVLSHLVGASLAPRMVELIALMERDSGLIGTSLAMMNLLLAAHDAGLGASAMTGPLVAADKLEALLRVPSSWGIVALVPVGFPAEHPKATDRKPIDKVVRWLR